MKVYRYEFRAYYDIRVDGKLILREFDVIKETDLSYKVIEIGNYWDKPKYIRKSKEVIKGFVRLDKKRALRDFICRYEKRQKILEINSEKVRVGLHDATKELENLMNNEKK